MQTGRASLPVSTLVSRTWDGSPRSKNKQEQERTRTNKKDPAAHGRTVSWAPERGEVCLRMRSYWRIVPGLAVAALIMAVSLPLSGWLGAGLLRLHGIDPEGA